MSLTALTIFKKYHQLIVVIVFFINTASAQTSATHDSADPLVVLGQQLFFDTDLSFNRTQSCASCHDPARAFTDTRVNPFNAAASIGADGASLGDRQAPSLSYAAQTPDLHEVEEGVFAGGYFWDGRASSLEQQATSPLYSPVEMALPDASMLKERLFEKDAYRNAFSALFGNNVWNEADALNNAFSSAVAAFQRTSLFSPFDSRYDRYLRGEYKPTLRETIGMGLFFSQGFANCSHCHQLNTLPNSPGETFSNYQYENIGLSVNGALREANGKGADYIDGGFMQQGRFKVPTLRNVAVTAPYMHNGIFNELRTVLLFYNKFNTTGGTSQINPETQQPWGEPEVDAHRNMEKLNGGIPLSRLHMEALEAFMRMLTDQQYEHLLP